MLKQPQPNQWSCLPTAFANVLDIDVGEFIKMIGHDGSSIEWAGYPEPYCRRCFHPQEVAAACFTLGYYVVPFEPRPVLANRLSKTALGLDLRKFVEGIILTSQLGVMSGKLNNCPHALAWDGQHAYDPEGLIVDLQIFEMETFYKLVKIVI